MVGLLALLGILGMLLLLILLNYSQLDLIKRLHNNLHSRNSVTMRQE